MHDGRTSPSDDATTEEGGGLGGLAPPESWRYRSPAPPHVHADAPAARASGGGAAGIDGAEESKRSGPSAFLLLLLLSCLGALGVYAVGRRYQGERSGQRAVGRWWDKLRAVGELMMAAPQALRPAGPALDPTAEMGEAEAAACRDGARMATPRGGTRGGGGGRYKTLSAEAAEVELDVHALDLD